MRRLQVPCSFAISIAISSVCVADLGAQADQEQLSKLTRGVTHESQTSDIAGLTINTSRCGVSDDATYGFTPVNPVKVGGGGLYVASRSKRFLHALRGPNGQGLHFSRLGSFEHTDGALLDMYVVKHSGIARHLYIDGYTWAEPRAPLGFLCGGAMDLGPPGRSQP